MIKAIVTVTIDRLERDYEASMRYCICGKAIIRRTKKGGQEKQYCCDACRQRSYRERKKQDQEIARLIDGIYSLPAPGLDNDDRDRWKLERSGLLQRCKFLEAELDMLQAEVEVLRNEKVLRDAILADQEAEITRLTLLLDAGSKKQRHQ